ncbi:MAG TPA: multidrug efflux SMR transporter [Actinomycetaceae bacterium]|nr:multidrug efflux SMR transporter [Actinomycetaceae bacterium]
MAWTVLLISGVLEAGWALSLKASDGLTKLWPSIAFLILMVISLGGLAYALRTLPVGPAYAVWTGMGAALTAIVGMAWLGEGVSVLKLVSLVLIIAGIIGLNLATESEDAALEAGSEAPVAASEE